MASATALWRKARRCMKRPLEVVGFGIGASCSDQASHWLPVPEADSTGNGPFQAQSPCKDRPNKIQMSDGRLSVGQSRSVLTVSLQRRCNLAIRGRFDLGVDLAV